MRAFLKFTPTLLFVIVAANLGGCSTSEPPQYQGKGGATPVIEDYYPSKTNAGSSQPLTQHQHSPTHQAEVTIPGKTADIFRETEKHFEELAAAIQAKDARMAHQHDAAIRKLVAAVPQRATSDTKADADALVRQIADAARAAHRLAHDDQWAEAADHVKRGQASLAKLKAGFKE